MSAYVYHILKNQNTSTCTVRSDYREYFSEYREYFSEYKKYFSECVPRADAGTRCHFLQHSQHMGHIRTHMGHIRTYLGHIRTYLGHIRTHMGHIRTHKGHFRTYLGHIRTSRRRRRSMPFTPATFV